MYRFFSAFTAILLLGISMGLEGCAPVEYSVVIVGASDAIAKAEASGASCTEQQLAELSPATRFNALESGTEVASTEVMSGTSFAGPICGAPYEYYLAVEYLKKAREEVGYSDYEAALEYAREARKYAQLAREITVNSSGGSGR